MIGITVRNQSESLSAFDRNDCPLSSESALAVTLMGHGFAWLDTDTADSLIDASEFVRTLEKRQRLKIACPEEVAWRMRYIDAGALQRLGRGLGDTGYGRYVRGLVG